MNDAFNKHWLNYNILTTVIIQNNIFHFSMKLRSYAKGVPSQQSQQWSTLTAALIKKM